MNEFKISYYLDLRQLLLLLSLIDQRPVIGLPQIDRPEDWQPTALSLLRDERLRCENGQLVMDRELSAPLLAMKNAERVCALYGKQPEPGARILYRGKRQAMLELLPGDHVRLSQVETEEVRELLEAALSRCRPMPEALLVSLPEDEIIQESLKRWEARALSLTEPPARWLELEEVPCVLECRETRWIWIEDPAAGLILQQDQDGTRAELDTASRRQALLRELGLEA